MKMAAPNSQLAGLYAMSTVAILSACLFVYPRGPDGADAVFDAERSAAWLGVVAPGLMRDYVAAWVAIAALTGMRMVLVGTSFASVAMPSATRMLYEGGALFSSAVLALVRVVICETPHDLVAKGRAAEPISREWLLAALSLNVFATWLFQFSVLRSSRGQSSAATLSAQHDSSLRYSPGTIRHVAYHAASLALDATNIMAVNPAWWPMWETQLAPLFPYLLAIRVAFDAERLVRGTMWLALLDAGDGSSKSQSK
ncbi:hypothetical protein FVE85_2339 [Porphyridium purpureum]|uniref:Uncharacterized protein n=1 Tax=Porphyridium purpureum TaxID=35688 RepID=A0A5J4YZJ8_PORPP|nr:hypothetical protein FVE85_2339 [Porphyridium purpureum]|eukprot:POR4180..scf209_3